MRGSINLTGMCNRALLWWERRPLHTKLLDGCWANVALCGRRCRGGASLCCKRNVLTFVCLDPSCQLITAQQRGVSGDEETLLGRPGKPKHAARVTSACLTGTLLHRDRLWPTDDMVFFHRGIFSAQQSSCRIIIYLNVTDVFVYQMLRKT